MHEDARCRLLALNRSQAEYSELHPHLAATAFAVSLNRLEVDGRDHQHASVLNLLALYFITGEGDDTDHAAARSHHAIHQRRPLFLCPIRLNIILFHSSLKRANLLPSIARYCNGIQQVGRDK